jgi:hypothetical protein
MNKRVAVLLLAPLQTSILLASKEGLFTGEKEPII